MASLKEVKNRIASVRTTRKITQARRMVASAHLHRAQGLLGYVRDYRDGIRELFTAIAPPASKKEPESNGKMAVIVMSSDAGMCGSFNSRMEKQLPRLAERYQGYDVIFYPIGKMIADAVAKAGHPIASDFNSLSPKASYQEAAQVSSHLYQLFSRGEIEGAEIVYYNFRNIASQQIVTQSILPLPVGKDEFEDHRHILEPSREELAAHLAPLLFNAEIYAAIISNRASEHAARSAAMQMATENANEILDQLQLSYNKLRQQNITSELLDIIGSSFA